MPKKPRYNKQVLHLTPAQEALVNVAIQHNYDLGVQAGKGRAIKTTYAAACRAFCEVFKADGDKMLEAMKTFDEYVITTLSSDEALDEVLEKYGLKITFSDPFSNLEEAQDAEPNN